VAYDLNDYLNLTPDQARAQWASILARDPNRKRQPTFTPVEVILSFGLFRILDPHRYGGGNIHLAPEPAHLLALVFCRTPGSITNKMLNLDGSRANRGKFEWQVYVRLLEEPDRFLSLYFTAIEAGRSAGLGPDLLPEYLGLSGVEDLALSGQDELIGMERDPILSAEIDQLAGQLELPDTETSRLVLQRARIGQHRFAQAVLHNYAHSCAFCGFSAKSLKGHKLLTASHIKPWANSSSRERKDVRNGIAACPPHDSAFDTGLLTVNGGLRIHQAQKLQHSIAAEPTVSYFFGQTGLRPQLLIPDEARTPSAKYLEYHQREIFRGPFPP
jgi:putative restriction endonuclease